VFKHVTLFRKGRKGKPAECFSAAATPDSSADQILFEHIKTGDTITIHTRNSTYTFWVTDEAERRGDLTGGPLEARVLDVKLMNVDGNKLTLGSRAMFLVESSDGVKRVSTSTISKLSHEKGSSR
jgi:hypothetical protein